MVWSTISHGVQVTIQDGALCGSTPRKVIVQYVCSASATTAKFVSVIENPTCTYTLQINTSITCTAAPAPPKPSTTIAGCSYGGKDLSPLSQYDLSTGSGGYTWYFRSVRHTSHTASDLFISCHVGESWRSTSHSSILLSCACCLCSVRRSATPRALPSILLHKHARCPMWQLHTT